jgi:hypothetical protein
MGLNFLILGLNFGSKSLYAKSAVYMGDFYKTTCSLKFTVAAVVTLSNLRGTRIDETDKDKSILDRKASCAERFSCVPVPVQPYKYMYQCHYRYVHTQKK